MGASLTFDAARVIEPGKPLWLRYGLYVHRDVPAPTAINARWETFASRKIADLPNFRKEPGPEITGLALATRVWRRSSSIPRRKGKTSSPA